jgi:N-acetylmuramoyl-L-alanine amidase
MKRLIIILFIISSILSAQNIDTLTYKICVNAGHGGHDSNDRPPVTPAGFWESEGNLTKALVLETILKRYGVVDVDDTTRAKFAVIMTRRNNRTQDDLYLSSIAAMANSNYSDWMHSIHSNASGLSNSTRHSTLMLYPGPTGDARINGLPGYPKCPEQMWLSSTMGSQINQALQTSGIQLAGDWSFYGTGQPYLGVFRTLQVPGTLSEGTFHDYYPETFRLQNLDFRINESWAIYLSFLKHFNLPEPEIANLAGIVRTKEEIVNYPYASGSNDKYKPIDSIKVTLLLDNRVYYGNTTMYVDKYTPQWSKAGDNDYYTNGANNNDGNNRNNGFYLFDSLAYGDYTLIFEAPDYWPDTVQVSIGDNKFFWNRNHFMISSVPPFVKRSVPEDQEEEHPAWEAVELQFSHTMDTASVRAGLSISPEAALIYSWDEDLQLLSLMPADDSLEVETEYTLSLDASTVRGNRDQQLDGNADGAAGDNYTLTFITSPPDIDPPSIEAWYPPKAARYSDLQPIISYTMDEQLNLSESIDDKFVLLHSSGDNDIVPTIKDVYNVNGKTVVSLFPTEELLRSNAYSRVVYSGLKDLFGNETTNNQSSNLLIVSTIPYYSDTLVIDAFSPSSISNNWKQPGFSGTTVNLLDGSATANTEIVNHGNGSSHSMAIYYKFDPDSSDGFLREYADASKPPAQVKFNNEGILQAWVFGDESNNRFRFAVDDPSGTGSHEVSPWYTIDFAGWQLIKWDLRKGETGEWPTVSDGTLDGELNFDSFQMEYITGVGTNEGTIYIEDLMFLVPGDVAVADRGVPDDYLLEQNYPNPFNPTTSIRYNIPQAGDVELAVYDMSGRRVQTLVQDHQHAGVYTVTFEAGDLPSGVYIAQLKTAARVSHIKMLLVK